MGEARELTGPDLSQGIDEATLVEGKPLVGHADGHPVMLVKSGGAVFATGASCSHYGGPLGEGLVVSKTVRCPWHHACFDLETGLGSGPGMNPISCFELVRERGLVRVAGEKSRPTATPKEKPASVVIIGGGPAGAACAETLRRLGYEGPITLVAAEPPGPVDRPNLSKDYLAGNAPEEWIPLRDEGFYQEMKIDFVAKDAAAKVDTEQKRVTLESGRALSYGALLITTGAEARTLSIPGGERAHVLRTLADTRAIIAKVKEGGRAVVIGSSFIGLEVAASLRARKMEVDVVSPDAVPLGRVLGEGIGGFVRALHEEHGVKLHLGHKPASIDAAHVVLEDGTKLPYDLVVAGVGVAPRTSLAEAAGLKVERGIVVDERLATSAPGVYAAGDVASHPDAWSGDRARIEHFVVAQRQGQAVARAMLGGRDAYRDVPFFWSAHYDVTIAYVGHASSWDRIVEMGDLATRSYVAAYEKGGKVMAAACIGRDDIALAIEAAMEAGDPERVRKIVTGG